ncbi:MAG: FAD-linked oxidase C-terminal domain-containing protein, partial [Armatimonadota bacterium]
EGAGESVREEVETAERLVVADLGLADSMLRAYGAEERERLWELRRAAGPLVNRIPGPRQAVLFIEDAAVRPDRLPEFVTGLEEILARHGVEATIIGHAGNGNVHVRPVLDLRKPEDLGKAEAIAEETADLVKSLRGTLTAEHGDGLSRSVYLPKMFGPAYDVFREVKRLFDPQGILNPGKIVLDEERRLTQDLRFGHDYRVAVTGTAFDDERLREEAEKCHGCGTCQAYCPAAVALASEDATARAKANLIREVVHGVLPSEVLTEDRFKAIMDLCVNCKLCLALCPTAVDVPWLCVNARAHYVSRRGQSLQNRVLADTRRVGNLGCAAPWLANLVNRLRPCRALMEGIVGIDARRELPRFVRSRTGHSSPPRDGRGKVVYFAGCFADHHDPVGEAEATVSILRRHGLDVERPKLRCCGAAMTTVGSLDRARADAAENVRRLKAYVDEGYDIVASAATCGLMVRLEYPQLLETQDARVVAAHTHDVHEYLLALHERGELDTDFGAVRRSVVYHSP